MDDELEKYNLYDENKEIINQNENIYNPKDINKSVINNIDKIKLRQLKKLIEELQNEQRPEIRTNQKILKL